MTLSTHGFSAASSLIHQSFIFNDKNNASGSNNNKSQQQTEQAKVNNKNKSSSLHTTTSTMNNNNRFSYRSCPICSQKLLVRINGTFVYKWISTHFSTHHHEWMHVVVNLHES